MSIAGKMKDIIGKVKKHIGTNGIRAFERQGDDINLFEFFDAENLSFIPRLKLNRWVLTHNRNGSVVSVQTECLHKHMSLNHHAQITKIDDGNETIINLQYGMSKVAVYDRPGKWYYAVAMTGLGQHPMILLTNIKEVNIRKGKSICKKVEIYLTRWKYDECQLYIKQSYNLEDVRVRSYIAIRNIAVLVNAVVYLTSNYMG